MTLNRCRRVTVVAVGAAIAVILVSTALADAPGRVVRNGLLAYTADLRAWQLFAVNADGTRLSRVSTGDSVELQPVVSPDGTMIAFVSGRDGDAEIYVRNVGEGSSTRLTDHPASDLHPAWSPDSRRLAFTSLRDGNAELYAVGVDGSGLARLTANVAEDIDPSWSPDGTLIAFSSDRDGDEEIYAMNADGSGVVSQLTRTDRYDDESWPRWSPDGNAILFVSIREREGSFGIYLLKADGTGVSRLTRPDSGPEATPEWSPDGSRIAFTSILGRAIYVMKADGTGRRRVTKPKPFPSFSFDVYPSWAPDGRILFASDRARDSVIQVASADGSGRRTVVANPGIAYSPKWSPDGKRLAFVSNRAGKTDIYTVGSDGRGMRRVTWSHLPPNDDPAWSPDGRRIAFLRGFTGHESELLVMNADGSHVTRVRTFGPNTYPCCLDWSPDGRRIVLSLEGPRTLTPRRLHTVAPKGGRLTRLTGTLGGMSPSWSPDGRRIVFGVWPSGPRSYIHVISPRGGSPTRLPTAPAEEAWYDSSPAWSPDGRLIAFTRADVANFGDQSAIFVVGADGLNPKLVPLPVSAEDPDWQSLK